MAVMTRRLIWLALSPCCGHGWLEPLLLCRVKHHLKSGSSNHTTLPSMPASPESSPTTTKKSNPFTKRRRAYMACTNCRQRKIKCITSSEGDSRPCTRCAKRKLHCEYVAVPEELAYQHEQSHSPEPGSSLSSQYPETDGRWPSQSITPPSAGLRAAAEQRSLGVSEPSYPRPGFPGHPQYSLFAAQQAQAVAGGLPGPHTGQSYPYTDYYDRAGYPQQYVSCVCPPSGACYCGGRYHQQP
ncbi:unnamed protein product [Mycena citricolor]|uniref:Zn(2)-C6 fungal-type domain-containing protein n=1 Tax=Mycena citricolor TaxID=2018698 RepID=A0AAD2HHM5_9AGAR|nr:unnamed protein product [Mycena citricolor]CAK5283050.1 unnamed protein product [Mycena citricolor]